MIATNTDHNIDRSIAPSSKRRWQFLAALLLVGASLIVYLWSRQEPTEWEIERSLETPRVYYFGGSGNLMVTAFFPGSGTWVDMPRREVALGQEFIFMGSFCKEIGPLHAAVYDQNDVTRIRGCFGVFQEGRSRVPGSDDSVYVLDRELPEGGFWPLRYVKPGERFHFQGRIYETHEGSKPNTMLIRMTDEKITTLPSPNTGEGKNEDRGTERPELSA